MKRSICILLCLMLVGTLFSACGAAPAASSEAAGSEPAATEAAAPESTAEPAAPSGEPTDLVFWTYVDLHNEFFQDAATTWNAANPNEPINLTCEAYPVDDMHNKLLITLQSGQGAPDIVDVNVAKFSNFTKGTDVGFIPLNDILEGEKANFLEPVLDIYQKDGNYYGIEYHVGAPVAYYNTEILDAAGVSVSDLVYWDDVREKGKAVLEATGKPIITFEVSDAWSYYIMIASQKSDWFDTDGNVIINNQTNVDTLQFMLDMIDEGTAITTPGAWFHSEEYYGFMSKGGAASMILPMWYMGRFTDFMPELAGKMQIAPIPKWNDESVSPVFGGTGTCITTQCESPDLAKRFLYDAKISPEGAKKIWSVLGFDPLRMDIWDSEEMKTPNKYTDFFGPDIFNSVINMKDSFYATNVINDQFPLANQLVSTNVLFKVLSDRSMTPAEALAEAEAELNAAG